MTVIHSRYRVRTLKIIRNQSPSRVTYKTLELEEVLVTLKQFLLDSFKQNHESIIRSLNDLPAKELTWKPTDESNSISFLVWHIARVLDFWVHTVIEEKPQLWEQGWSETFAREPKPNELGYAFSSERVASLELPEITIMIEYLAVAETELNRLLQDLDDENLATLEVINPNNGNKIPISSVFQQLVWELNQHGGQIAYIRGMKRGLEDRYYTGGLLS
ncbi:DinB family protein [SAR202 cluster bacterium AD-802-E10_MRT_200m]|nr:DinB family protein [SAR202 cluster bacterium AD-802-E10_MRT_200m]